MKKRYVKGLAAGVLALSLAVGAPVPVFAQQAGGESIAVTAEAKAKKPTDTNKQDTAKPEDSSKQDEAKKPESSGKQENTKKPTKAKAQEVGKVTCTSSGKVNISFKQKVTYTDALKAVIQDENGAEIPCKVTKKNKNLLTVTVNGLVKGQKYTITIEGILGKESAEPVTIQKVFTAKGMKTQSKVGKVTVQSKKFVVLKMKSAVDYKDATVTVTDSAGKECAAKIVKKAKGSVKVQITGMKKGETYTITINGIKTKKEKNYGSITSII